MGCFSRKTIGILAGFSIAGMMIACGDTVSTTFGEEWSEEMPQQPVALSSSIEKTESSSSEALSSALEESSSSVVESSSSEPVESSSSEVEESSSSENVSSSSEEVIESSSTVPSGSNDKNTQQITEDKRGEVMDAIAEEDVPDVNEMEKSETVIFEKDEMDFSKNDYYCYDAASDGWYKISGSKVKSFWAWVIDAFSWLTTGKKYFDYSKICDDIYIKAKAN